MLTHALRQATVSLTSDVRQNQNKMLELIKSLIPAAIAITVPSTLFWLKFQYDARKRLDDILIELEHELYRSDVRPKIFAEKYLEVRKAATDLDRWIINPLLKKRLRRALESFRGQSFSTESIFELRGTPHEKFIDVFLTGAEVRCLAPYQSEFTDYMVRIAELRKITGSRIWTEPNNII